MRQALLKSSMMVGVGSIAALSVSAGAAGAADGIKLDVGGYFSSAYVGIYDGKHHHNGGWGAHHNYDAFKHDAEVQFKGETTLDNGLTVGARIELEGETDADQIDKSWVYFSGGFGEVRIGDQDDALETQCVGAPGGTANFSAFSPTGWGSNDPIQSNSYCFSADNDSQKIVYISPMFSGFQLAASYTPNGNAETYVQAGVNTSGTPTNAVGTARHIVSTYANYTYESDDWSLYLGGGGSWQLGFNHTPGSSDGKSQAYQTGGYVVVGGLSVGGLFQYFDQGGKHNNMWIAGAGAAYNFDAWTVGLQYSHGRYNGDFLADGNGNHGGHNLNRVVATLNFNLAPGVDLDADLGYTWYHDTRNATPNALDTYQAGEIGIGSSFSF